MNNLEKFILIDSETQKGKDDYCNLEYEIYGLSNSWGGVIFERDINKPEQILFHISNGLKVAYNYLDKMDCFFRKGDDNFYMHYKNCEDYTYSKEIVDLSKDDIIKIIKEYVYLHHPNLMERTLMGWNTDKGVLHDPNHCSAFVRLDDNKYYSISKCMDKVTIKTCLDYKKDRDKENLIFLVDFTLDEKMYEKALDFSFIKKKIYKSFYGKLSDEKIVQYQQIKMELEKFIKNS